MNFSELIMFHRTAKGALPTLIFNVPAYGKAALTCGENPGTNFVNFRPISSNF